MDFLRIAFHEYSVLSMPPKVLHNPPVLFAQELCVTPCTAEQHFRDEIIAIISHFTSHDQITLVLIQCNIPASAEGQHVPKARFTGPTTLHALRRHGVRHRIDPPARASVLCTSGVDQTQRSSRHVKTQLEKNRPVRFRPVIASNFHRLEPIVPLRSQQPAKAGWAI